MKPNRADNEYAIRSAEDHALGCLYVSAEGRRNPYWRVRWQVRRDLLAWVNQRRKLRAAAYRKVP